MMGPKEKKERALGEHLHVKAERCQSPKCALVRKPYKPGVHGPRARRRALSEFGLQLHEKQKFKISYGLDERNLRNVYRRAEKVHGSTAAKIIEILERRLDNTIFRLGIKGSRSAARQLILHGHIFVGKKRVRSPGFEVSVGDVITIRNESIGKHAFTSIKESIKKYEPPAWLHLDKEKMEGKVLTLPNDLTPPFEINLLVESFSK